MNRLVAGGTIGVAGFVFLAAAAVSHSAPNIPDPAVTSSASSDPIAIEEDLLSDTAAELSAQYTRPGFAGTSIDYEAKSVTLRWRGEIPEDLAKEAGVRDSITVELLPARFSDEELISLSKQLLRADRRAVGSAATRLTMVGPNDERSGLLSTFDPARSLTAADKQALLSALELKVPVEFVPAASFVGMKDAARSNDSPYGRAGPE